VRNGSSWRFPLRADPKPDECARSLVLRTGFLNGYASAAKLLKRFMPDGSTVVRAMDVKAAALCCRQDPKLVAAATGKIVGDEIRLLENRLHLKTQWASERRRWCPKCFSEDNYYRAWWSVTAITTCPAHRIALRDRCDCGRMPMWLAGTFRRCGCGMAYGETACEDAAEDTMVADRYLIGRLTRSSPKRGDPFGKVSLGDLIEIITCVGVTSLSSENATALDDSDIEPRLAMTEGFRIISNFPDAYMDLLDRVLARPSLEKQPNEIFRRYGAYYRWLRRIPDNPLCAQLRQWMRNHCRLRLALTPNTIIMMPNFEKERPLSASATMRKLGLGPKTGRIILAAEGVETSNDWRKKPFKVPEETIPDLDRYRGHLSREDVMEALGICRKAFNSLMDEDIIRPLRQAGRIWIFPADEASSLLEILKARQSVESDGGQKSLLSIVDAARNVRAPVGKIVRLILDRALPISEIHKEKPGLAGLMVSTSDAKRLIRQHRHPGLTREEAADKLAVKGDAVRDFIRHGLLSVRADGKLGVIPYAEFERFRRRYILTPEIFDLLGIESSGRRGRTAQSIMRNFNVPEVLGRSQSVQIVWGRPEAVAAIAAHLAEKERFAGKS
jgi:hypothetical protein